MVTTPGISGFKITNYYKFILYISGVILILSIFVDSPGINNEEIRDVAFWVIVAGLLVWIIEDIIYSIDDFLKGKKSVSQSEYNFYGMLLFILIHFIQFIIWGYILIRVVLPIVN